MTRSEVESASAISELGQILSVALGKTRGEVGEPFVWHAYGIEVNMTGPEVMTTSIPSLNPASEIVSGGKEIIAEFPTLRIFRMIDTPKLSGRTRYGSATTSPIARRTARTTASINFGLRVPTGPRARKS
jgi:hypothetical protein